MRQASIWADKDQAMVVRHMRCAQKQSGLTLRQIRGKEEPASPGMPTSERYGVP